MTERAAERAGWFGRISNDDYAIHLAKFYAAMYSAAFFESDVRKLIAIGRKHIPEDSALYQGILEVHEWSRKHPAWRVTRKLIYDKYYRKAKPKDLSSIVDALPNGLMGIMALLYADADFKKTLSISTTAGLDSDNQPATTGGLIGVMDGFAKLPQDYVTIHTDDASVFHNTYVNHTREGLPERTSMNAIVDRICNIAEQAILVNGGQKRVNAEGETVYVIKTDF
jgi:hypothetical protein